MYIDNLEIMIIGLCFGCFSISLMYIAYLGIRYKLFKKKKDCLIYMALGCIMLCLGFFMDFIYDPLKCYLRNDKQVEAYEIISNLGLIFMIIGGGFWCIGYYKAHKIGYL